MDEQSFSGRKEGKILIDTHVHFWKLDRGDYSWMKEGNSALYRDYLPDHLDMKRVCTPIKGVIAVQAASTVAETAYLLSLADRCPWIVGVVGWLDLTVNEFDSEYERLSKHPKFKGIRLSGKEILDWHDQNVPVVFDRLRDLKDRGHTVDLLVRPQQLNQSADMLEHVPELPIAINHLGVPPLTDQDSNVLLDWKEGMKRLAEFPHTYCKLSGIITREDEGFCQFARLRISWLAECFGVRRVMFGSDWPVCLQKGDYEEVLELYNSLLPSGWGEVEREFAGSRNARRFYQLENPDEKGASL